MIFDRPVFIVGAPRSGTSLLQKLVREHPAFVSVPRESDVIWSRYVHPEQNDWRSEGMPAERLSDADCQDIQNAFGRLAVSSATWRRWSSLRLMEIPATASLIRMAYPIAKPLLRTTSRLKSRGKRPVRLVDKSVHMGIWLDLVLRVFPDARIVHITRHPDTCIASIAAGWRDAGRFESFRLPTPLNIPDYEGSMWKFPLPYGWGDYVNSPIEQVAAFQWNAIQTAILAQRETLRDRYLQIRLEDLSTHPDDAILEITRHIEVEFDDYFQGVASNLPVVNARPRAKSLPHGELTSIPNSTRNHSIGIAEQLGYADTETYA